MVLRTSTSRGESAASSLTSRSTTRGPPRCGCHPQHGATRGGPGEAPRGHRASRRCRQALPGMVSHLPALCHVDRRAYPWRILEALLLHRPQTDGALDRGRSAGWRFEPAFRQSWFMVAPDLHRPQTQTNVCGRCRSGATMTTNVCGRCRSGATMTAKLVGAKDSEEVSPWPTLQSSGTLTPP